MDRRGHRGHAGRRARHRHARPDRGRTGRRGRGLPGPPLFRKIVDVDPELLLPYVLDRRGASQEALLGLLGEALREGHADGSVRPGHTERQARTLLLTVQSFTLSLRTMTDEDDAELDSAAFLGELRTLLERTLTP